MSADNTEDTPIAPSFSWFIKKGVKNIHSNDLEEIRNIIGGIHVASDLLITFSLEGTCQFSEYQKGELLNLIKSSSFLLLDRVDKIICDINDGKPTLG